MKVKSEVAQLCPTLCDSMDCSLPGFFVDEIFLARVLEWVAISFSRGSSWPRDRTQVSCIAGRCFTLWATAASQIHSRCSINICMKEQELFPLRSELTGNFPVIVKWSEVAQSCPTLCKPVDSSLHQAPPSTGFSRQEYWSGLPFPSPRNLLNPGIEPRSLAYIRDQVSLFLSYILVCLVTATFLPNWYSLFLYC